MRLRNRIARTLICSAVTVLLPVASPGQTTGGRTRLAATEDVPRHSLTFLLEGHAFVSIPAGEFTMGSASGNADEAPPRRVRLSKSFELSRYEITQAQWRAVMDSPHSKPRSDEESKKVDPAHFKGPELPVESVSWDSVQEFLKIMNTRDERHVYRLPTEAEWEYAAVTGQATNASGDTPGWCEDSSDGRTHPIGGKSADKRGLHDMVGNVMEWVQDWYAPDAYQSASKVDPLGPAAGSYKVYRGGAWLSSGSQCRPTYRGFDFPTSGYYSVGFRLVRTRR
ncbi:MAG TPA: formylglycine-generating enzyme family protein [Bryobacteraceae bacterium]|nr:formylglycine-generating enzyme family protein [Bryobacteraceae bacterium]